MKGLMVSNQPKEQEQNIQMQQQNQETQQPQQFDNMMQQQNETLASYDTTKLNPLQQYIYEKHLSKAQKQELLEASQVADGAPIQEHKPEKQSVKKKVSTWWNRSKRTKMAQQEYGDKSATYLTKSAIQAEQELKEQTDGPIAELVKKNQENGNGDPDVLSRCGYFFFQGYKKNENGEPLNAEERKKKESDEKIMKAYASGKLEERRPILNRFVNEALNFKFTPDMLSGDYLESNYKELRRMSSLIGELHKLLNDDPVNKEYFEALPQKVKKRLELVEKMQGEFSMAIIWRMKEIGVNFQSGTYEEMDKDSIGEEYTIEKNGKEVTKYMTHAEYYKIQYMKYMKENASEINELNTSMTVESAIKEEYIEKKEQEINQRKAEDAQRAKEKYNDPDATYLTYRIEKEYNEFDQLIGPSKQKFLAAMKKVDRAPGDRSDNERIAPVVLNGYKQNEFGEPLNEEEQKKKEEDDKFIEEYSSCNLDRRIPYLNKFLNRVLKIKMDYKKMNEEYMYEHSNEVILNGLFLVNYQNVMQNDPINKKYLDMLPDSVKQRLDELSQLFASMLLYMNAMFSEYRISVTNYSYKHQRPDDIYEMAPVLDKKGEEVVKNGETVMKVVSRYSDEQKKMAEDYVKDNPDLLERLDIPMTVEEEIKKYGLKKPEE